MPKAHWMAEPRVDDDVAALSEDQLRRKVMEQRRYIGLLVEIERQRIAEWSDKPLPEDEAISAAHPIETDRHDLYAEAMRLVGARHSKHKLVGLVNWLLYRIEAGK